MKFKIFLEENNSISFSAENSNIFQENSKKETIRKLVKSIFEQTKKYRIIGKKNFFETDLDL